MSFLTLTLTQPAQRDAVQRAARLFAGSALAGALAMALPVTANAQAATQDTAESSILPSGAAEHPSQTETQDAAASPLKPNPAYAQYPRYTGTLGTRHITLRLGKQEDQQESQKQDDLTDMQGEYQFDATGEVRQIAGERNGNTFSAEDTTDGKNISGNWSGTFAADGSLSGARTNPDDSGSQPFDLKPVSSDTSPQASTQASTQTPPSTSTDADAHAPVNPAPKAPSAAPASSGTHPVEGAANLNTED